MPGPGDGFRRIPVALPAAGPPGPAAVRAASAGSGNAVGSAPLPFPLLHPAERDGRPGLRAGGSHPLRGFEIPAPSGRTKTGVPTGPLPCISHAAGAHPRSGPRSHPLLVSPLLCPRPAKRARGRAPCGSRSAPSTAQRLRPLTT